MLKFTSKSAHPVVLSGENIATGLACTIIVAVVITGGPQGTLVVNVML